MPTSIPKHGITYDVSPQITVTLDSVPPPPPGVTVRVYRNGVSVGTAVHQGGLVYMFHDDTVPFGTHDYTCAVQFNATLTPGNNNYPIVIVDLPTVSVTSITEDTTLAPTPTTVPILYPPTTTPAPTAAPTPAPTGNVP